LEANFFHYVIHKLHWSPSQINDWVRSEQSVKAFYFGSLELKIEQDRREVEKLKRG